VVEVGSGSDKVRYLAHYFPICFFGRISAWECAAVVDRFPGASQHGIVREEMMLEGARKRSAGARSLCCSPRCSDGLWSGAGPGH
jgi:hypothetical protein